MTTDRPDSSTEGHASDMYLVCSIRELLQNRISSARFTKVTGGQCGSSHTAPGSTTPLLRTSDLDSKTGYPDTHGSWYSSVHYCISRPNSKFLKSLSSRSFLSTGPQTRMADRKCSSSHCCCWHQMEASGGKRPGIYWIRGWADRRANLDSVEEKAASCRSSSTFLSHCTKWGIQVSPVFLYNIVYPKIFRSDN